MTYSASATDANYCMGLLTADADADLLDPANWSKSPTPVFTSNDTTGQYGPGHNCFTVDRDGRTDVLVYHAAEYAEIDGDPLNDPNRHTRVQRLGWKADGTPDFGVPVADTARGRAWRRFAATLAVTLAAGALTVVPAQARAQGPGTGPDLRDGQLHGCGLPLRRPAGYVRREGAARRRGRRPYRHRRRAGGPCFPRPPRRPASGSPAASPWTSAHPRASPPGPTAARPGPDDRRVGTRPGRYQGDPGLARATRSSSSGTPTVCDQPGGAVLRLGPATARGTSAKGLSVANHADSGDSTVSYLADQRLSGTVRSRIHPGDLVLVQLAHNDKTTDEATYRANLQTLVAGVREQGGRPVLVTPVVRRWFNADGTLNNDTALLVNGLGVDHPAVVRSVAAAEDVPLIDLTAKTKALVESLGVEGSKALYLYDEKRDNTHTSAHGATVYAGLVRDGLVDQHLVPRGAVRAGLSPAAGSASGTGAGRSGG